MLMGFRYTGIRVRDLDRSIAFYTTVLRMRVTWRMKIRETGGEIAVLKSPRGTQRLELNWYPPRGRYRMYRQGDELDHLAFAVSDVDAFLRDHRGDFRIVMKAFDEGTDRLAYVTDPDGAWIELMSRRKDRSKSRTRASD
jgi:lactoylglutathione lyase